MRKISLNELLFIFIFLSFLINTNAQNNNCKCNSHIEEFRKVTFNIEEKEYEKANQILNSIPNATSNCKRDVLLKRTEILLALNKITAAENNLNELKQISIETKCLNAKAEYLYLLGIYNIKKETPDLAIQHLIEAKEIASTMKDTLMLIKSISRMTFVFNKMQQPKKAIEYDYKQLELAKAKKDDKLILLAYSQMQAHFGVWYDLTENFDYIDSLKNIAAQSLILARKTNLKLETAQTYSVLAGVALVESRFNKSLQLCDSGLLYLDRSKDFRHVFSIMTKKCDNYIELKDLNKSIQFADTALKYAILEKNALSLAYIYERIYEIAKLQGNYTKALEYHEKYVSIRDSIRTLEKTEKINELEQKYNKAQNEKTIKELSQKKQIATLRNKIYLTTIIAALLAISLIIIYNRQKTLKSKQENMEIEQRLNRARMNPHFFFNTLNSLQTFSMQENKDSKVARYLSKYAKIMRETLESTYKEMNTIEQETDYLTNYLDLQKLRYPEKFEYSIHIDETIESNETYIPAMIIQPFIENSIEHGLDTNNKNGIIELNISIKNNRLVVEINDNGSGFTADKKAREYPSRATQIIKDRLLLLNKKHKTNASFDIGNGKNEKGTFVKIILPLIYTNESFNN